MQQAGRLVLVYYSDPRVGSGTTKRSSGGKKRQVLKKANLQAESAGSIRGSAQTNPRIMVAWQASDPYLRGDNPTRPTRYPLPIDLTRPDPRDFQTCRLDPTRPA